MKENLLIDKSIVFSSRIIKLHQYLIRTKIVRFHETILHATVTLAATLYVYLPKDKLSIA